MESDQELELLGELLEDGHDSINTNMYVCLASTCTSVNKCIDVSAIYALHSRIRSTVPAMNCIQLQWNVYAFLPTDKQELKCHRQIREKVDKRTQFVKKNHT